MQSSNLIACPVCSMSEVKLRYRAPASVSGFVSVKRQKKDNALERDVSRKAAEQLGVAEQSVHHWELPDGTRLAAGPRLAASLDEQEAVAVLGCEVTLVDIMAAVQQHSRQLEQQSKEIGDLRKGLVEHTVNDIRRTARLVMARARRPPGIAETHEELHTHFSASVSKASQLQAFVSKHCPGVTRSDFEEHFDELWGKRCGEYSVLALYICHWCDWTPLCCARMLLSWASEHFVSPLQVKSMQLMLASEIMCGR